MRFSYVQAKRGQDESDSGTHAGRPGGAAVRGDRAARPGPRPGARKDRSCGRELHRRVPAHKALQGPAAGHAGTGSGGDCERRWPRRGRTQSWGARRVCEPARRVCRVRRGAGRPVSTREKAALARGAGADDVILYTEQDFETEVKRLTNGAGLQVIYDSVGKTTFEKGLGCLAPRGMMVLY